MKLLDRRARILAAARSLFLNKGFTGTSLDDIIATTGGSRRSIYTIFGDKEGLFEAVMRSLIGELFAQLDAVLDDDLPPERWLYLVGVELVISTTAQEVVAALRQFITIADKRPELAKEAYRHGPPVLLSRIANYLRVQTEAGKMNVKDPEMAAEVFVGSVQGNAHLRAMLLEENFSPKEIDRRVRQAIEIFLNGVR